ncbi:MAG: N-6 DNA methylase [Lewinellaceae bacterium]|nr:N-6 DNA methylase [Lewinellaceae bacterium]
MLDTETKRRIDTARDILVGKVPDPKSQVEQITLALIYKFMDDMDVQSVEWGGVRSFFTGDYERYAWSRLFDPSLGGFDMLNLYSEGLTRMGENPNLPLLFRSIFKNAFLPFRDAETLRLFLKTIHEFTYDHSERLGDAYEYLLSVLGSQGDAGQFRTPRHIIDFIVQVINPQKDETILDPACGTAGFLVSAYKHILSQNTSLTPGPSPEARGDGDLLNTDERNRLVQNFTGYDIDPGMIRNAQVNLYLHQFPDPRIFEYDTLSDEDRWNDTFDIILANPPFMTPKGFKATNKRYRIQANRSEVLFVDYIAEHIHPLTGRAAIIVPEGIIFQSSGVYQALRRMLVQEGYLWAVVSLPAGVFQPYSGVKTSILFLDRRVAAKTDRVHFVKIQSDGYDLGAQRRANTKSDLPAALEHLTRTREEILTDKPLPDTTGTNSLSVEKAAFGEDFNLSMDRYRGSEAGTAKWEMVRLGDEDLFKIESGGTPNSQVAEYWNGSIKWATLVDLPSENFITESFDTEGTITEQGLKTSSAKIIPANSVIVSSRATIGRIGINRIEIATNQGFKNIIIKDLRKVVPEFVALMMTMLVDQMNSLASGGTFKEISKSSFSTLEIPLPPLSVQRALVGQIEEKQKAIAEFKKQIAEKEQEIKDVIASLWEKEEAQ